MQRSKERLGNDKIGTPVASPQWRSKFDRMFVRPWSEVGLGSASGGGELVRAGAGMFVRH
jgi:hypothetical protein